MGNERASHLCFLGGLGLLIFSFVWPWMVGGERAYSDEDAIAFQNASQNLHEAQDPENHQNSRPKHAGKSPQPDSAEVKAAKEKFAAMEDKREAAIVKGQTVSLVAKYLAAGVLGIGCVLRWLMRP